MGLNRIAVHLVMGFGFERNDVDDATQEATLYAIRQIGKFRCEAGATAFAYFTSVIGNALRTYRKRLERTRMASLDDGFIVGRVDGSQ